MNAKVSRALASNVVPITDGDADVSDASLVNAARDGNAWATEALFRRHLRRAYGLAYRLLGNDDDLGDVVQESMTIALTSLKSLREPSLFSTWLGRVVINTVHRTLRRRRLMRRFGLRRDEPVSFDLLVSNATPPDVAAELAMIYGILRRLPTNQRIALVLRRVEAHSLPEIADEMGTSLSSVKRWLTKAEAALEQELRGSGAQS